MIAALYVDKVGPYPSIPGVDVWDETRDARLYAGPHPVVAHPPCGPWGKFKWRAYADHRDCAPIAVEQVRRSGGVLEHPMGSGLWPHCRLPYPGCLPDKWGGYTIEIRQCDWGHPAEKLTWLYIVGTGDPPPFPPPGRATHCIADDGRGLPHLPKRLRHITPMPMALWLVEVARRCRKM